MKKNLALEGYEVEVCTSGEEALEQYQQEPHAVASLVLLSNLGSLVVMPIVLGLVFAAGYV